MWPLLVGVAYAGLHADLKAAAAHGADIAVTCTSATEAATRFRRMATAMGHELPPLPGWWREISGAAVGDDAIGEGPIHVAIRSDPSAVEFGFPTTLPPGEVAARLAVARGGIASEEGEAWRVSSPDEEDFLLTARPGGIVVRNAWPVGELVEPGPAVIDALPEAPGCGALMSLPLPEVGTLVLGLHIPFTPHTPTSFAIGVPNFPDLAGIAPVVGPPASGSTRRAPEGVVVVGLGLNGVNFSRFLEGKELRKARAIQRRLPIGPGTTIALFELGADPTFGAVVPLTRDVSPKALTRRLRRVSGRQAPPAVALDATHTMLDSGATPIYIATEQRRILLATEPGLLAEIEAGDGEPWVRGRAAEMAGRFPIVSVATALPDDDGGLRLPEPLALGLGVADGLIVGEMYVPLTLEEFAAFAARAAEARERRKNASPPGDGT